MLQQFDIPSDIIQKVEQGDLPLSTFAPYLSPLHNKNVIGTNGAFMLGEWISVAYFCDTDFFRKYKVEYLSFRNLKATCVNHIDWELIPQTVNIKRLKRDYKPGLSDIPDTIRWNNNTGGAAINFAVLAGARRLLLLGFDMRVDIKTHWHSLYQQRTQQQVFDRFLWYYQILAKDLRERGVEVLNISPHSALDVFPRVALKEVL